jgi:hypothetical protein
MKILKKHTSTHPHLHTLIAPITYANGDKFLAVDMSRYQEPSWGVVDFSVPQNNIAGIYTCGLADCCAVAIIKRNGQGNIIKAWLLHLPGGLMSDGLDELPAELQREDKFEIIVKFGTSEYFPSDLAAYVTSKLNEHKLTLINKYKIHENQITFMENKDNGSLAITQQGVIGLAPIYFPSCGIFGATTEKIVYLDTINESSMNQEIADFQNLISTMQDHAQVKMKSILEKINLIAKNDKSTAAKGLYFTRYYLTKATSTLEDTIQYKKKMASLGPSWFKIGILVIATAFLIPGFYTIPKLATFFHKKSQLDSIVDIKNSLDQSPN